MKKKHGISIHRYTGIGSPGFVLRGQEGHVIIGPEAGNTVVIKQTDRFTGDI